jgi:hypothetical protein
MYHLPAVAEAAPAPPAPVPARPYESTPESAPEVPVQIQLMIYELVIRFKHSTSRLAPSSSSGACAGTS